MSCPARAAWRACTNGDDYGPCDDCLAAYDMHGEPDDLLEAQVNALAGEIKKLKASVRHLSAAMRAAAK